ncbi:MAG: nucleotidyltransferase domain-containing protein [Acidobacteria bacterium]|nr:nucleotidyltransferase domain-containing protein [Acidobacteriota bacterium]
MKRTQRRRAVRPSRPFLLRLPQGLHASLQRAARAAGLSLNEYCLRRLSAPGTALSVDPRAAAVVARAADLFGEALVAVAIYGSWARGEAGAGSDVDALIVVEPSFALTRELYRAWDRTPISWDEAPVDPHFVHAPDKASAASGLWGEVAVEGIVVFERDLRMSSALVQARRAIAGGRLVRREVHGQSYWTAA